MFLLISDDSYDFYDYFTRSGPWSYPDLETFCDYMQVENTEDNNINIIGTKYTAICPQL